MWESAGQTNGKEGNAEAIQARTVDLEEFRDMGSSVQIG